MKITVWIRPEDCGRDMSLRLDTKFESLDTPMIQRYGFKLADAIQKTTNKGKESAK